MQRATGVDVPVERIRHVIYRGRNVSSSMALLCSLTLDVDVRDILWDRSEWQRKPRRNKKPLDALGD